MEITDRSESVYLSLGSNLGDRFFYLTNAVELIGQRAGTVVAVSSVYENPPVGFDAETQFYNLCLLLQTSLSPLNLLHALKSIEGEMGRLKTVQTDEEKRVYYSRVIDIDIILMGNKKINTADLTLPHPMFRNRKFVLIPLNEIAPGVVDPVTCMCVSDLLNRCEDLSVLNRINRAVCF